MALTDPLADFLQAHPITQDQREAVIILMLVIMYADKKLTLEENTTLRHYEKVIKWDSERSLSDFFANRIAEIRTAMRTDNQLSDLLEKTCARITDDNVKTITIKACNDMAAADHIKDADERFLIEAIVNTLQG